MMKNDGELAKNWKDIVSSFFQAGRHVISLGAKAAL